VTRLRHRARRHWVEVLIVIAAIGGALEVALASDAEQSPRTTAWLAAPAIALVVLSLLARRRAPFAAPALLWLLVASLSFVDGRLVVYPISLYVAGLAASFLLGTLRDEVQGRLGLATVVGAAAIVMSNAPGHAPSEVVTVPALFAIAWVAGFAQRERAAEAEAAEERARHAERERAAAARVAVAEERTRIARELHDIVAHAVSVMVLQVGAVRHRLPDALAEDVDALEGVEQTGRTALAEMRRLLGAMRREGEDLELAPRPGIAHLDALLQAFRRSGLPVHLHVDGEPFPLPGALDLSAYRIVQEGLTNALKHARASQAHVDIRYAADELRIDVRDDGDGDGDRDGTTDGGIGHGLVGVRERVKVYGGEMSAATANGGGFVLSTRLPLTGGGS
jgi:signal transduction histidine kinase